MEWSIATVVFAHNCPGLSRSVISDCKLELFPIPLSFNDQNRCLIKSTLRSIPAFHFIQLFTWRNDLSNVNNLYLKN